MEQHLGQKKWFVSKKWGWGWTPYAPQGWLCLVVYVGVVMFAAARFSFWLNRESPHENVALLIGCMLLTTVLVAATAILVEICYVKGGAPQWHWGKKQDKESD